LGLVEGRSLLEEFGLRGGAGRKFLSEACEGLVEGKIKIQLSKANEVATPSTTVAEEQILGSVNVERGTCFRMQGAESDELLLRSHRVQAPVVPPQVVEQGNLPFQFFRFLPHRPFLGSTATVGVGGRSFQARMVGEAKNLPQQRSGSNTCRKWAKFRQETTRRS